MILVVVPATTSLATQPLTRLPVPEAGWDWARLDSGEVIKGELIVVQDDVMYFDSDKFDELEIDWEDVVAFRLSRPRVFRFKGDRIHAGMGELRGGKIRIVTPEHGPLEFPANEIISIVYTSAEEFRNWQIRIGANLTARSGNTDQADLTANAKVQRQTPFTRWTTSYSGSFSQAEGDRTANNHRVSTQFDVLLTDSIFLRVPAFEFFRDEFQNIDGRYTPGVGLGYQPIDTAMVDWHLTLGPAAQITEFRGGGRDEDAAVVFGSELSFDFPRDIDLDLNYQLQLIATDLGKTSHAASAVVSFEIWGPLDLDVGGYLDRIEEPQRDSDGQRPNRNDFRLTVGLSLEF